MKKDKYIDFIVDDIFKKTFKYKGKGGEYSVMFPFFGLSYCWDSVNGILPSDQGDTKTFFFASFSMYVNRLYGVHYTDTIKLCDSFIYHLKENLSNVKEGDLDGEFPNSMVVL